jgi:hypothetical protein
MGTGIFLTMYSLTESMLYRSWAEIGTTGAESATVPEAVTRREMSVFFFLFFFFLSRMERG